MVIWPYGPPANNALDRYPREWFPERAPALESLQAVSAALDGGERGFSSRVKQSALPLLGIASVYTSLLQVYSVKPHKP